MHVARQELWPVKTPARGSQDSQSPTCKWPQSLFALQCSVTGNAHGADHANKARCCACMGLEGMYEV